MDEPEILRLSVGSLQVGLHGRFPTMKTWLLPHLRPYFYQLVNSVPSGRSCNLKANVHAESMHRETVSGAQHRPHDSISTHMTYIIWPVDLDMEPIRIIELERFL